MTAFEKPRCMSSFGPCLLIAVCLPLSFVLVGCNDSPPTGVVAGSVSYGGKPVALGMISASTQGSSAIFRAAIVDGNFRLEDVPVGTAQIAIHSHRPGPLFTRPDESNTAQQTAPQQTAFVRVPRRYGDFAKSGLHIEILNGEQEHDFSLAE